MAVFNGSELRQLETVETLDSEVVRNFLKKTDEKVRFVLLSAVKPYSADLDVFFESCFQTYLRLHHQLPLPIRLNYATPHTLGMDRIAAVAGASAHFEKRDLLVIDAGTCITYDFLNKDLIYSGGAISPGIRMRFKALHTFTGQLPFINWKNGDHAEMTGDSTETSIVSGVVNGAISEVTGFIDHYRSHYDNLQVVMTGGDLETFDKALKNRIFADPNLVLLGLNKILRYNIED
jgi:type III pantothenate kinase